MKERKKGKKVKKRFVIGEGYPWYFRSVKDGERWPYNAIALYLGASKIEPVEIETSDTGNWNKVRIICEVLE